MTFITTLTANAYPIGVLIVIIFLLWMFVIKPISRRRKKNKVQPQEIVVTPQDNNLNAILKNYIVEARKQKYSEEDIIKTFKEKGYTQQMINSAFGLKQLPELPQLPTPQLSTIARMGQGFKVMGSKIANSNYVQGIQAEQQTARADDFIPTEFSVKKKQERESDAFSTDFSKLTKVEI